MNTKSSLAAQLSDKQYRDAFVASQIRIGLPMQCRALRESREWTQPRLAEAAGMSQPRISEIERPGERKLNLETLLRLASAFDVALQVRFVPFSQLVDDNDSVRLDSFHVEPFPEDMARLEGLEKQMRSVVVMKPSRIYESLIATEQTTTNSIQPKDEPKQVSIGDSEKTEKTRPKSITLDETYGKSYVGNGSGGRLAGARAGIYTPGLLGGNGVRFSRPPPYTHFRLVISFCQERSDGCPVTAILECISWAFCVKGIIVELNHYFGIL